MRHQITLSCASSSYMKQSHVKHKNKYKQTLSVNTKWKKIYPIGIIVKLNIFQENPVLTVKKKTHKKPIKYQTLDNWLQRHQKTKGPYLQFIYVYRAFSKTWNHQGNRNVYCSLQPKALHAAEHDADKPSDDTCYSILHHHHQHFLVLDSERRERVWSIISTQEILRLRVRVVSCNTGGEVSQVLAVWTLRLYFAGTNTENREHVLKLVLN